MFLTGHLSHPVLLVRRAGDERWQRIVFRAAGTIELRVENEPTVGGMDAMHATLYYRLSRVPLPNPPLIAAGDGLGALGTVVGCSDTQWP